MATLKDIADICGVSTATVSYVLSGRGTEKRITEQTQQEIRKAAESLDYEYKGRNKAVLKYRVTVYFSALGAQNAPADIFGRLQPHRGCGKLQY